MYFLTYFPDSESVESCEKWSNSPTQQVDLAFNIFFMVYFFIRVRAREEKFISKKLKFSDETKSVNRL